MQNADKEVIYINMLGDSLLQKDRMLDELITFSKRQTALLEVQEIKYDLFLEEMQKKQLVINRLAELDKGFELVYSKVSEELKDNKEKHQDLIKKMQELIKCITEKGMQLRNLEQKNKILLDQYLIKERNKIRNFKMNNQAASNYYKSMAKMNASESYFMDSKR
ncbi:MAG: hypothetical protein E7256_17730 [Lachnospiraceae bacterium]|nr:hypothetical protein [Lachnospiraceae bacterium]